MTDFVKFHEVIKERVGNPNAFYYAVPWWEKEVQIFTDKIPMTIAFIESECSDEELYWFGEVLEDVVQLTQCRELWDAFVKRAESVKDEELKKSIMEDITNAEMFFSETSI